MCESVHHSLICTASYMVHATGEEMLLRKFFKFGVRQPSFCTLLCFSPGLNTGSKTTGCKDKIHEH